MTGDFVIFHIYIFSISVTIWLEELMKYGQINFVLN